MQRVVLTDTELEESIAQYDKSAKNVLSNRIILAGILKGTAEEFKELSSEVIAEKCIGDDIMVSRVRLEPGETNRTEFYDTENSFRKHTAKLLGDRTEDVVPGEGKIYYDIRFSAYAPDREEVVKVLVNVEAQKKFHVGYAFVTRGIFYGARMISAQLETEFTDSEYSNLKKVYSIWICMNSPNYIGNAISEYRIAKNDIVAGIPDIKKDYDKLSVVVVCLNRKVKDNEVNELIGMLNTVFHENMSTADKKQILADKHNIVVDNNVIEEVGHMCNLGEGVYENGVEDGIERGRKQGIAQGITQKLREVCINMYHQKFPPEQIALIADISEAEVEEIIKNSMD